MQSADTLRVPGRKHMYPQSAMCEREGHPLLAPPEDRCWWLREVDVHKEGGRLTAHSFNSPLESGSRNFTFTAGTLKYSSSDFSAPTWFDIPLIISNTGFQVDPMGCPILSSCFLGC